MSVVVRFAPSPTGHIHIGNVRTVLLNWLFALREMGRFILRFDDTDRERSKKEYVDSILFDLAWLGILADRIEYQSLRTQSYCAAIEKLQEKGLLYPCYETPEELAFRRKNLLLRKLPPVYDREALRLTQKKKEDFLSQGRKPHWRFLLPNSPQDSFERSQTPVFWNDLVRGHQSFDLSSLSDPVLVREDGSCPYTLPSVVDDIDFQITHVLRGNDHVTNTAVQIALFQALDAPVPQFGHHNLLLSTSGEVLSKRSGAVSVSSFREEGIEPEVVASFALLAGTSQNPVLPRNVKNLSQSIDFTKFSSSQTRFDPIDLRLLNQSFFHTLSFEDVKDRLEGLIGIDPRAEYFWHAVKGNIVRFSDVIFWWRLICAPPSSTPNLSQEDKEFVRSAFDVLPLEPWNEKIFQEWIAKIQMISERKGKALYAPLRLVITGCHSGPSLAHLLVLIGRKGILERCPGSP